MLLNDKRPSLCFLFFNKKIVMGTVDPCCASLVLVMVVFAPARHSDLGRRKKVVYTV